MRTVNESARRAKQISIMEKCFETCAEVGLVDSSVRTIAEACGCNSASLYQYFKNRDDLIIQSTEYCMSQVEQDFMAKAPTDVEELWAFIEEIPYWTAEKHGKKYRLMYQVYTHPKYIEQGKAFFAGVSKRYQAYARQMEPLLGMPCDVITPLIFIFVRASVHYALFEDEYYLKSQMSVLKQSISLLTEQYRREGGKEAFPAGTKAAGT